MNPDDPMEVENGSSRDQEDTPFESEDQATIHLYFLGQATLFIYSTLTHACNFRLRN